MIDLLCPKCGYLMEVEAGEIFHDYSVSSGVYCLNEECDHRFLFKSAEDMQTFIIHCFFLDGIFHDGYEAFGANLSLSDNPYSKLCKPDQFKMWDAGFKQADKDQLYKEIRDEGGLYLPENKNSFLSLKEELDRLWEEYEKNIEEIDSLDFDSLDSSEEIDFYDDF